MAKAAAAALLATLSAAGVAIIGANGADAALTPRRSIDAAAIDSQLARGQPVFERHVVVGGNLHLPGDVKVPLSIRNSVFAGTVTAASTTFQTLVDFSGSRFNHDGDFSEATFEGPLLLASSASAP